MLKSNASVMQGSLKYQLLTEEYLNEACDVVSRTIFTHGTISSSLEVSKDQQALQELTRLSIDTAKDGLTIVAIDTKANQIAGVAFNKILSRPKPNEKSFFEQFADSCKNPKSLRIAQFLVDCDKMCDLFEYCNVDCIMEILFLGTLPEYRKQGIANELTRLSVELGQELQAKDEDKSPVPKIIYGVFTSFISQKIVQSLGFELATEKSIVSVVGDQKNKNVKTTKYTIEFKKLK